MYNTYMYRHTTNTDRYVHTYTYIQYIQIRAYTYHTYIYWQYIQIQAYTFEARTSHTRYVHIRLYTYIYEQILPSTYMHVVLPIPRYIRTIYLLYTYTYLQYEHQKMNTYFLEP